MRWVPAPLATVAAWVLTATFAWAVVAKFVRGNAWPEAVTRFGFRGHLAQLIVFVVPLAEAGIVALLAADLARPGAALSLALLAGFSGAIVRARAHKGRDRLPCGCFGTTHERDYRLLLGRNGALALLAALILLASRETSLAVPDGAEVVPLVLIVLGSLLVAWMAVQTASALRRR